MVGKFYKIRILWELPSKWAKFCEMYAHTGASITGFFIPLKKPTSPCVLQYPQAITNPNTF